MSKPLFICNVSVEIYAPAAQIWPFILEPALWKSGVTPDYVSGPKGQIGEVCEAIGESDGRPFTLTLTTVALEEDRRRTIILETPEQPTGFATWELAPSSKGCRVSYSVYQEYVVPHIEEALRDELFKSVYETNRARLIEEFDNLKSLVETNAVIA